MPELHQKECRRLAMHSMQTIQCRRSSFLHRRFFDIDEGELAVASDILGNDSGCYGIDGLRKQNSHG